MPCCDGGGTLCGAGEDYALGILFFSCLAQLHFFLTTEFAEDAESLFQIQLICVGVLEGHFVFEAGSCAEDYVDDGEGQGEEDGGDDSGAY